MKKICISMVVGCTLVLNAWAQAQSERGMSRGNASFVTIPDIESKIIQGEFRFCPRENMRGIICGDYVDFFGKRTFIVRDWWSPETYVKAYAQGANVEVLSIEPTANGSGIIIRFL